MNFNISFVMCFYPWCCALSCSVLSDSVILGTAADQAPLPMGILQARILGWISSNILLRREYSLSSLSEDPPEDLPKSWIKPRSPALQVDSLPSEPPGKPKSTRVGRLSLLHGTFPTQESNWGLLNCRWILYQVSYWGSPEVSHK